jgi:hypothetical protein
MRHLRIAAAMLLAGCLIAGPASAQTWQTLYSNAAWTKDSDCCGPGEEMRQAMPALPVAIQALRVTYGAPHAVQTVFSHVMVCSQLSASTCKAPPIEETCKGVSGLTMPAGSANVLCDTALISMQAGEVPLVGQQFPAGSNGQAAKYSSPVTTYYNPANPSGPSWNQAVMIGPVSSTIAAYGVIMVEYLPASSPPPPPPPVVSTLTAPGIPGGGRLTNVHGVAELYQDSLASFIDYAPYRGTMVPTLCQGGASFQPQQFTSGPSDPIGLTLNLDSSWLPGTIHRVYVGCNGAVPVLGSAAWVNGAPPVADGLFQGVRVNGAAVMIRRDPTHADDISCAANGCKMVGDFMISATAGSIECDFSSGFNRQCGIWNSDNRIDGLMKVTFPPGFQPVIYQMIGNSQNGSGALIPGSLPTSPAGAQLCGSFSQAGPNCWFMSGSWNFVGSNSGLSATILAGYVSGDRVVVDMAVNHRDMFNIATPQPTQNTSYQISVGWGATASTQTCGDSGPSGNVPYSADSTGFIGNMNQEIFAPSSAQMVFAATRTARCTPPPFGGTMVASMIDNQYWSYGQNWLDSGDDMMTVKFRY